MGESFHVHPKEADSEHTLREENVKTWYVMEGDYVHFKCSSPDEALRILAKLISDFPTCEEQRKNLDEPIFYETDNILVDAYSAIAKIAARQLKLKISTTRKEPLPDPETETKNPLDQVDTYNKPTPENNVDTPKSKTKYDV